jgi:AcrR family transcriptional regulator
MSSPGKNQYHHGNLRTSLIETALKRLSEQNVETLSLRDLAQKTGVSIAAVYRHFPNKDALLAELAVDGFNRLISEWEQKLPDPAKVGAEARFSRLGEIYVEFALASPAHYRLMFVHGDLRRFPSLQEAAARCFGFVLAAASETVKEAGVKDKWVLPTANAAWSLVHGYVMLSLGGRLTATDGKPHLPPGLLPHFLQLPKEALQDKAT